MDAEIREGAVAVETAKRGAKANGGAGEHVLVCLSASPSNAKIVRTAARMADAFGGSFTALFVQTPESDRMPEADQRRLRANMKLAEQLGASIVTVQGEDVSLQIAEFARVSGVTRIVIGRSYATRRHFWSKPTLTERLIAMASNLDVHIIPDSVVEGSYRERRLRPDREVLPSVRDLLIAALVLAGATLIGSAFRSFGFTEANIITVYLLGVLLTALFTKSYLTSALSSLGSVLVFNFFFTEPRLTLHAYEPGYAFTFAIMLIASLITGSLANRLKDSAKRSARSAFRSQVLFDTNQLLQRAEEDIDMLRIAAGQLQKLFDRDVVLYPEVNDALGEGQLFGAGGEQDAALYLSPEERAVAEWVFANRRHAGATTHTHSEARCLYLAVRSGDAVFGVVGVRVEGRPLDSFENGMFLSVLGECALAVANRRNARGREEAALLAKNEQLRANLLRTISHDLRTPLTSISGNAGYLLSEGERLDGETRARIYTDIYDDSMWLNNLVENLLSITRIGDGGVHFHMTAELIDEVIEEALKHIDRRGAEHRITVDADALLLVRIDARLIVQVLINLVNNAVKYTPPGSNIRVCARREGEVAAVYVSDDGPGMPDEVKARAFEMFYTGETGIADGRRSLGLGLALCKSIVAAHGGEIALLDTKPHGCTVRFTLPMEEVELDG